MTPTMPTAADLLPLLPELVLVGAAFALLMLDLFLDERRRVRHPRAVDRAAAGASPAMIAAPASGGQGTVLNGMFVRDIAADVLKLVDLHASPRCRWSTPGRTCASAACTRARSPVLVLFAVLGMMLMVSAGSLVMVYLGLELLALCPYALVAIDRDNPLASEAAMKYFVLGSLASGMLLYGMSMVYGATGTLRPGAASTPRSAAAQRPTLLLTGVVFMVVGIAFKFGAAPFHMWLPDVYQGAPTPITLFIGSAPKLAAFGMAYRLLEAGVGPLDEQWRLMLAGLAVAVAGDRQPGRDGADQPQAHAGVFDDLARRLPVPRPRRRRRRRATRRRCSTRSATRSCRPRRSARSWCCRAAASRPTRSTTSRA